MKILQRLQTDHPLPEGTILLDGAPEMRAEAAEAALAKGHFVVWPTEACTSPEVLQRLASMYGSKIFPFAPLLSAPRSVDLMRAVRADEAGEIGAATHRRTRAWGARAPWANDASTLILNDLALLRRLFGPASQVFATRAAADEMEFFTLCLALENGALGNVVCHVARDLPASFAFDYAGCKGNLIHEGREGVAFSGARPGEDEILGLDEAEGVMAAWSTLLDCLRGNAEPSYGTDEWIQDLRTLRAAKASAEGFRPQEAA